MKARRFILSWFAPFLLGLWFATSCSAAENQQKWNTLESNIKIVLNNVESYQNSLTKAENELKQSKLQLMQAQQESKKLNEELVMSRVVLERMWTDLKNANESLANYEKSMKAKIRRHKRQKYLYAIIATGAVIYASKR